MAPTAPPPKLLPNIGTKINDTHCQRTVWTRDGCKKVLHDMDTGKFGVRVRAMPLNPLAAGQLLQAPEESKSIGLVGGAPWLRLGTADGFNTACMTFYAKALAVMVV